MKQNNLLDVIFMITEITFLVVLNVLVLSYFIYCCVTIYHNIEEIIFWAIMILIVLVQFNTMCIIMIKELLNK